MEIATALVSIISGVLGIILSAYAVRDRLASRSTAPTGNLPTSIQAAATVTKKDPSRSSLPLLHRATTYLLLAAFAYAALGWFSGHNELHKLLGGKQTFGCDSFMKERGGWMSTHFIPEWVDQQRTQAMLATLTASIILAALLVNDLTSLITSRRRHS